MKSEKNKFFLALILALLLLLGVYFAYARYAQKVEREKKKPVAVCGKTKT